MKIVTGIQGVVGKSGRLHERQRIEDGTGGLGRESVDIGSEREGADRGERNVEERGIRRDHGFRPRDLLILERDDIAEP